MKRKILSEKNIVVVLFVIVLVVFSFAQEDTKKIEKMFLDHNSSATSVNQAKDPEAAEVTKDADKNIIPASQLR